MEFVMLKMNIVNRCFSDVQYNIISKQVYFTSTRNSWGYIINIEMVLALTLEGPLK